MDNEKLPQNNLEQNVAEEKVELTAMDLNQVTGGYPDSPSQHPG